MPLKSGMPLYSNIKACPYTWKQLFLAGRKHYLSYKGTDEFSKKKLAFRPVVALTLCAEMAFSCTHVPLSQHYEAPQQIDLSIRNIP